MLSLATRDCERRGGEVLRHRRYFSDSFAFPADVNACHVLVWVFIPHVAIRVRCVSVFFVAVVT